MLEEGVTIGPLTVVHGEARIGARSRIGSHCVIGEGDRARTVIGAGAVIRSHSVIYAGSTFGRDLETGHHAVLRECLDVGRGLRVGTASDLQGSSSIGHFVRIHSNVFVAKRTTIEEYQVGLSPIHDRLASQYARPEELFWSVRIETDQTK